MTFICYNIGVDFEFGLLDCVRYTGDFVIPGTSLYRGLRYIGDFVIPGTSLYRGLRYIGDFVISGFHCT